MQKIRINTSTPYDVLIGENILKEAVDYLPEVGGKAVIIWDENIPVSYIAKLGSFIEARGADVMALSVQGGESAKTLASYEKIIKFICEFNLSRSDLIFAVGGGTVGDVSGFVASTYKRGVKYVQMPTTVLAACDSSVGGKTALNFGDIKNVIGTFYQPSLVVIDTAFFNSLSDEQFKGGLAEIIKYGFLGDADMINELIAKPLSQNRDDYEYVTDILSRCIRIKEYYVSRDEKDTGVRNILNFGHTFGHAIEGESNFKIHHGQAVAMGMAIITRMAEADGICESGTLAKMMSAFERNHIEWRCPYNKKALLLRIANDKKITGGSIKLILPEKPGSCLLKTVTLEELRNRFDG